MSSYGESYKNLISSLQSQYPKNRFQILAVSKTKPYEVIREAYLGGIRVFGENYIPEAVEKFTKLREEFPEANEEVQLHHIGPVQSGTLRKLFGHFQFTHGVGSFSTLNELLKRALKEKKTIRYFIQCNLTKESSKNGMDTEELILRKKEMVNLQNEYCIWEGMMGMGPSDGESEGTGLAFQKLNDLRNEYFPDKKLSMGMSGDYDLALQYGSDYLRIGSKIFGDRVYGTDKQA
ncbi:YggS family pyridoxal phosphate-dependent enzyme [Leptospira ilyithenensis]|uniref:YggS family pyridoxal phosphate-dependent enzyme n=1 Tax=Leptospira ilyithenensis TaxID=2484901 RepID=A0A4R9LQQ8_9LEPT|nr:YggS family pyridoxal phosphate-dependent enzyme [Leptospira ilyithenensis]TGN11914.1 YggS family pyridoxal phosphate-dependent enzyme [Leptospira ilyithenensis]